MCDDQDLGEPCRMCGWRHDRLDDVGLCEACAMSLKYLDDGMDGWDAVTAASLQTMRPLLEMLRMAAGSSDSAP